MPTYEFYCEKCKKYFSVAISISEYEKKKIPLPKLQNQKIKATDLILSDGNIKKKLNCREALKLR
jgi:hypothetical protein